MTLPSRGCASKGSPGRSGRAGIQRDVRASRRHLEHLLVDDVGQAPFDAARGSHGCLAGGPLAS